MDEKSLLELWNTKRSQIVSAQMGPTLVLIAVVVLSGYGVFANASDAAKILAIGVAAATGILAVISQYAAIREAQALVQDLNALPASGSLAKTIARSESFLRLTAVVVLLLSLAIFVLVVWAVLG